MKKKIKYEVDKDGYCVNKCGHQPLTMIGSVKCRICPHFISNNEQSQTVTCNHPNNKPDKEDGEYELQ